MQNINQSFLMVEIDDIIVIRLPKTPSVIFETRLPRHFRLNNSSFATRCADAPNLNRFDANRPFSAACKRRTIRPRSEKPRGGSVSRNDDKLRRHGAKGLLRDFTFRRKFDKLLETSQVLFAVRRLDRSIFAADEKGCDGFKRRLDSRFFGIKHIGRPRVVVVL